MDYADEHSDDDGYGEEYGDDYREEDSSQRLYERDRYSHVGGGSFSYYQHFNRKVNAGVYNNRAADSRERSDNEDSGTAPRRQFTSRKEFESQQYSSGDLYNE